VKVSTNARVVGVTAGGVLDGVNQDGRSAKMIGAPQRAARER